MAILLAALVTIAAVIGLTLLAISICRAAEAMQYRTDADTVIRRAEELLRASSRI